MNDTCDIDIHPQEEIEDRMRVLDEQDGETDDGFAIISASGFAIISASGFAII